MAPPAMTGAAVPGLSILLLARTAAGPVLFGTVYLAAETLPGTPAWGAAYRVLPAGLVLLLLSPAWPRAGWWLRSMALGGLNFAVPCLLQLVAAQRLSAGVTATLVSMAPLVVPPLAAVLLGEPIRLVQLGTAGIGLVGLAILLIDAGATADPIGVIAAVGAAAFGGAGFVLTRRWGMPAQIPYTTALAWQMLFGTLLLGPVALALEGAPPQLGGSALLGVAWLSLAATAFAYTLYFGGLHRHPSTSATALLGMLAPMTAGLLGWAVAGQQVTASQLVGAALVCGAVAVGQLLVPGARPSPDQQRHAEQAVDRGA